MSNPYIWSSRRRTLNQTLGNRLGILTSVLLAMVQFFRCQKSVFNLENNKLLCQGNFFVYHVTGPFTLELFFELCIFQGYIQNFERNWKSSICIKVNNFGKSVNL